MMATPCHPTECLDVEDRGENTLLSKVSYYWTSATVGTLKLLAPYEADNSIKPYSILQPTVVTMRVRELDGKG